MKTFKTFYSFLWRYKGYFTLSIFSALIAVVLSSSLPFIYRHLIDNFSAMSIKDVVFIVLIYGIIRLADVIFDNLKWYLGDISSILASMDLRRKVFSHLQNLDFVFHVNKKSGELISKIKRGDGSFTDMDFVLNRELISDAFKIAIVASAFYYVNINIVYIFLGSLFAIILTSFFFVKKNMEVRKFFNKEEDNISHIIADNLISYETVKYFAKEKSEENNLKNAFKSWLKSVRRFAMSFRQMDISVSFVSTMAIVGIFLISALDAAKGRTTVGDFIMVAAFTTQIFPNIERFIFNLRRMTKNYTDLKDYFAILDYPLVVLDPEKPLKFECKSGEVEFKNLSFSYPNGQEALKNISIIMPAGSFTALAGRSGSGKTTITKLLMRVYDPDDGQVLVDGFDIRQIKKEDLRRNIGIVPQEPILFNNTIGYNIGYPLNNATREEIETAAKMANLHDFIITLEKGYDTIVGERGVKLSGGQKQRLAIARVFLLNPKIIIFDEATSHLDSESEKLIQESMEKLAKGKTFIAIAHRLSTIMKADKIIVLDKGELAEEGLHAELLSQDSGIYKRLWELQTNHEILENGY